MLYDQALLTEGSPLPDPARFAARVATLMQAATPLTQRAIDHRLE